MLVMEEDQEIREPIYLLPMLKGLWVVLAIVVLGPDFKAWLDRQKEVIREGEQRMKNEE